MLSFIFKKNLIILNKGINPGLKFNYLNNPFKRAESVTYLLFLMSLSLSIPNTYVKIILYPASSQNV